MNAESVPRALEGIVGGDFNDPTNERIIYLSALGLAIVGLALLVGTILWWRRGRQEHPVLAPLEVMSRRSWFKAPERDRRRRLDQVRLAGSWAGEAEPVRSEPVDLQALVRSTPQAFDDLREPGEEPVVAEEGSTFVVDGEGDAVLVADAPDEVDSEEAVEEEHVDDAEQVDDAVPAEVAEPSEEVVVAEPDATAVAIERPTPEAEPSVEKPEAPVEVFATGPNDSLK
ncbi:MAG: hypothetical protein JJD93_09350 [Ilumatobacteraceae bacterium]|nr:hypothetical protein [Ilumatobacteraceae bacterium]